MNPRSASHRYVDPLEELWATCAARTGFRLHRSSEVFAASSARTIIIGSADLDSDDCAAQMIFHELCHSLIEGEESFDAEDWGLGNTGDTDDRDVPREHACLRLQAHLSELYGLRRTLAPTTDFRAFYDALPTDPLAPRHHAEVALAIIGLRRAEKPPWGPHLHEALEATATICAVAAPYARPLRGVPSLLGLTTPRLEPHPAGLRPRPHRIAAERCGACAWQRDGVCRQSDGQRVDASWPGCERFEPALDCQQCGACCRAAYGSITIEADDPVVRRHPELIVDRGGYLELLRTPERCAALAGGEVAADGTLVPYGCTIYDERPAEPCRAFERSGPHCLTARRRVGLSF